MEDASDADVASAPASGNGNGNGFANGSNGPPIGVVKSGRPYLHESTIRRKLANLDMDLSRDGAARLQGVQLIDDVRNFLQLCVFPAPGHHAHLTQP